MTYTRQDAVVAARHQAEMQLSNAVTGGAAAAERGTAFTLYYIGAAIEALTDAVRAGRETVEAT